MSIFALYGSSRDNGNTEALTDLVLRDLDCTKIHLREREILPIVDQRHTPGGFDPVSDDYDAVVAQMLQHDVLVFATPLYWYGMSGRMKNFFDRWSQSLRDPRYTFKETMKGKRAYLIVVGGDNPRVKALPLVQQFQYIFDFVGTKFDGHLIGHASKPGDIGNDLRALADADQLNRILRSL